MDWLALAREHFSQTGQEPTDKTDERGVSSVSSVRSDPILENHEAQEPPLAAPVDWRPLAQEYHLHHFRCPTCQAAGRGYGMRCGVGAALWVRYQDSVGD